MVVLRISHYNAVFMLSLRYPCATLDFGFNWSRIGPPLVCIDSPLIGGINTNGGLGTMLKEFATIHYFSGQ